MWRLLLFGATATLLLCALDALLEPDALLFFFVIIPAGALFLLGMLLLSAFSSRRRQHVPTAVAMLVIYGLISFAFLKHQFVIRSAERWLLFSLHYKAEVLKQPEPQSGEFKHIEWDGWGLPGAGDTTAYLVFDPADSLAQAAKGHAAGKYPGIPCAVPKVNRLEKHWYAVVFYTDEQWGKPHFDCGGQ